MSLTRSVFDTVANRDSLGFWAGSTLRAREVVDFLGLTRSEVAQMAGVAVSSVRFDHRMPHEVLDRLEEIASLCALVAQHFEGDIGKTARWFRTRNTLLGDRAPRDLIRLGRSARLRQLVMNTLNEATPPGFGNTMAQRSETASRNGALPPLIDSRRPEISALSRQHGVRRLAVFGSVLRDDFDPVRSDLDVVVEFGPPRGESAARQYFDFKGGLERLFGRPVDLVELQAMPDTRLKRIIERTLVPVYEQAA